MPQPLRRLFPRLALALAPLALAALLAGSFSAGDAARAAQAAGEGPDQGARFHTDRGGALELPLPSEEDAFAFVVFGDRTGGPPEGIQILARAVDEVNLLDPDLVMTVGDLIQGYNELPEWLEQMREYKDTMGVLRMPWYPVAGNHDVYWRGPGQPPPGEHEQSYEEHFGPLWYAFRHKTAWFVALYSDEGNPVTGKKAFNEPESQRMSEEQLAFLRETLERAEDAQHVFLFLHHPRWIGGNYGDDWERVHELLARAGNVTAVFAGHIHRMRYDGPRDGIEYFTLATVGGGQRGDLPAAGYLHHYLVVTVRPGGIQVASLPVGSASDPRAITGEVSELARRVADGLVPRELAVPRLVGLDVHGHYELELRNPVERPLELRLEPAGGDPRWRFAPDHVHRRLGPGESARFSLSVRRASGGAAGFDPPILALSAELHFEDLAMPLPVRELRLGLDPTGLLPGPAPEVESVLSLDGHGAHLRVEHGDLELPDGPLTVEGWLAADAFHARQGFINKTQSSDFGIFLNDGQPSFLVHLDGAYVHVRAPETVLEPGRWHHVAGVFDGSEARLYVDGLLSGALPAAGARTIRELPLLVGADPDGRGEPTSPFPGRLDEVRVSRVARYAGERFEPARRHEPDADTVLLLPMDGEVGPYVLDSSPRRAHALRLGGPHVVPD